MRISDWSQTCALPISLHQFVGDIIVFGQKLPRDVKGDAARTMARDGLLEPLRDEVERLVPTRSFVTDHGRTQAAFEADCYRSEERRVGKECVRKCRSRGSQYQ